MVKHTKKFYIKQKEKEIQKKLREEEKRMLKESAYKRRLKRKKEKYRLEIAKDREEREERVIAFLGKRNWKKFNVEGKKHCYYAVDDGHIYNESGKEVGHIDQNGYVATLNTKVHRLIWEAFKGKIPEGYQIDHINTIRNDNRLSNLRLVTPKENCNNPLSIEHYKQSNKAKAIFKYHNIIQMDLENNVIAKYNTVKDIPSKYNKSYIYNAIEGRNKTACGYIWKANA